MYLYNFSNIGWCKILLIHLVLSQATLDPSHMGEEDEKSLDQTEDFNHTSVVHPTTSETLYLSAETNSSGSTSPVTNLTDEEESHTDSGTATTAHHEDSPCPPPHPGYILYYPTLPPTCSHLPSGFRLTHELPLGLLSDADWQADSCSSDKLLDKMINTKHWGCKRFERGVTEECKYYGDCCKDPMRVWEQLDEDTFTCKQITSHTNTGEGSFHMYVVEKCPMPSNPTLKKLCETDERDDVLVSGTKTGIAYKNIYCAVCNGALVNHTSLIVNHTSLSAGRNKYNEDLSALQFWWTNINCPNDTTSQISDITGEAVSGEQLVNNLLSRGCVKELYPPPNLIPHQCTPVIGKCPPGSGAEISRLCERTTLNFNKTSSESIAPFKTTFCELCWRGVMDKEDKLSKSLEMNKQSDKLADRIQNATTLIRLRPKLQTLPQDNFSNENFKHPPTVAELSSITNNLSSSYEFSNTNQTAGQSLRVWDLGSMECESTDSSMCGLFIKAPSSGCTGPGCGEGMWQNLTGHCNKLPDSKYDISERKNRTFVWPLSVYNDYYSSCRYARRYGDNIPELERAISSNCQCDPRCVYFGECCYDAITSNDEVSRKDEYSTCVKPVWANYTFPVRLGYRLIDRCPSDTADSSLREQCEHEAEESWSTDGLPVVDMETGLSYKNKFCAVCHGANQAQLLPWRATLFCLSPDERNNLNSVSGKCRLEGFIPPQQVGIHSHGNLYPCFLEGIVSSCPPSFSDWKLKEDCESGDNSWVYHNSRGTIKYKNSHCAICNMGDDIRDASLYETTRPNEYNMLNEVDSLLRRENDVVATRHYNWTTETLITIDLSSSHCFFNRERYNLTFNFTWPFTNKTLNWQDRNHRHNHSTTHLQLSDFCDGLEGQTFMFPPYPPDYCAFILRSINTDDHFVQFTPIEQLFKYEPLNSARERAASSEWINFNGSLKMCADGRFQDSLSEIIFTEIRLSSTAGIEVLEYQPDKSKLGFKETNAEVYDYILLAASWLFIIGNIVYIIKGYEKVRLTDLLMLCMLTSLLSALITYAVSILSTMRVEDHTVCEVITALLQFSFLSTMTWASAFAYRVTQAVFSVKILTNCTKMFKFYILYGLAVPLVFTLTTVVLSRAAPLEGLEVYRYEPYCFLKNQYIMLVLFILPMCLLITGNVVMCGLCVHRLTRTRNIQSSDKARNVKTIIAVCKLTICFGAGYVLIFFAYLNLHQALWVAFQIFVEIQGVLVVSANMVSWSCVNKKLCMTRKKIPVTRIAPMRFVDTSETSFGNA